MNAAVRADLGVDPDTAISARANLKRIRRIEPLARAAGFDVDADDRGRRDRQLADAWLALAARPASAVDSENQDIIAANAARLGPALAAAPADELPKITTPLLHLLPQGVSATPVFVPAPHEAARAFWNDFTRPPPTGQPWMHQRLLRSLGVVFGGFAIACVIGIPLGIACGSFDLVSRLVEPFTDFFRYMPAPTFGLLLVAAFGVAGAPKIALVFLGTFPHLVLMLANTTRLLDRRLVEAAQTLGAGNRQLLGRVVIPGILPNLYTDLRVLLGWAWTWLVIAELIGTKTGLTGFIDTQGDRRNFDRVFPVILMIGVIGFGTDQILQVAARRLFPWAYTGRRYGFFRSLLAGLPLRSNARTAAAEPAAVADAVRAHDANVVSTPAPQTHPVGPPDAEPATEPGSPYAYPHHHFDRRHDPPYDPPRDAPHDPTPP